MSASILENRTAYYYILESSQKGTLDITAWLKWFLQTLLQSLQQAMARIDRVLAKVRFWQAYRTDDLCAEQVKVLIKKSQGNQGLTRMTRFPIEPASVPDTDGNRVRPLHVADI
jgi:Fic family protein